MSLNTEKKKKEKYIWEYVITILCTSKNYVCQGL